MNKFTSLPTYHKLAKWLKAHKIPPKLIINWNQAEVKLVPSENWTMEQQGASRVEIACINDKRQITVTLAGSMSGELLPMQLLYQGTTNRCHPKFSFPVDFDVWHTPNHWANEDTTIGFIQHIIIPLHSSCTSRRQHTRSSCLSCLRCFQGPHG